MTPLRGQIVLDACLLANARAADIFLRLAQEGAHEVLWSVQILEETERTQRVKFKWKPRLVDSYHARLAEVFPHAVVSGHEKWIEQCTNDEGDRHVLACAIEAGARHIVTFNERHFKDADLARWNIRAIKPEDYLLALYESDPELMRKRLVRVARKKRVPTRMMLEGLLRDCPKFAEQMLSELPEE